MNAQVPSQFLQCPSLFCPPPPPFLVQPYLSRYPPDQRESIFVVVPLALSPLVPPGLGLVNLLSAVRGPFHVIPPCSYAMLVVHSHLALNRHIALIRRYVDEPAPRAQPTVPRLLCLLTMGPLRSSFYNDDSKFKMPTAVIRSGPQVNSKLIV